MRKAPPSYLAKPSDKKSKEKQLFPRFFSSNPFCLRAPIHISNLTPFEDAPILFKKKYMKKIRGGEA